MLGKGLESLIPQKGNQNTGGANDGGANSVNPASVPIVAPLEVEKELPAAEPLSELPAKPAELDLPVRHEEIVHEKISIEPDQSRSMGPVAKPIEPVASPFVPLKPVVQQITPSYAKANFMAPATPGIPIGQKKGDALPQEYVFHIEVDKIKPNSSQPRREFNEAALREMANSIREFGFLQPLVVSKIGRETPNGVEVEYQLIAGERRLRAAKLLGLREVPAIIRNVDLEREKLELAVIENLQRENLNSVEMARAFQRLQEEFRMTQREIAAKLGKSRETVANTVRLLDLPEYIQDALQKGQLSESHARFLLAIDDPSAQKRLYDDIVEHGLTTRDVKERVRQFSGGVGHRGRPSLAEMEANLPPELRAMQDELSSSLGAPVQIQKGAGTGKITISFYSQEELENILRRLGKDERGNI